MSKKPFNQTDWLPGESNGKPVYVHRITGEIISAESYNAQCKGENMETREYRTKQFERLSTEYSEYAPTIKIVTSNGETNWFNITGTELEAIKQLLLKDRT